MPSEGTKILDFNQYQKSDKTSFIIYADLECLIKKTDGYENNPEKSSATKLGEHILSCFSMSKISSFKSMENKYDVYRANDCMKRFCESLKEHTMEIITFKRKK